MSARQVRALLGLALILAGNVIVLTQIFSEPDGLTGPWCFVAGIFTAYGVEHVYTNRAEAEES